MISLRGPDGVGLRAVAKTVLTDEGGGDELFHELQAKATRATGDEVRGHNGRRYRLGVLYRFLDCLLASSPQSVMKLSQQSKQEENNNTSLRLEEIVLGYSLE